jgi:transposase
MAKQSRKICFRCRRLQQQLDAQAAALKSLQDEVTRLQEKLAAAQKNSATSSKPPSSDLVKPPKPNLDPDAPPRSIGGQPGHAKHQRELFPPEQVTHPFIHELHACPCCAGNLRRNGNFVHVVQQIDIEAVPLTIEQHTSLEYWCERCQKSYDAPLPLHIVKGGLVGPNLTALIAYLKGACHASFSTVRNFLRDVLAVTLSRGQLSKILGKVSAALAQPYEELLQALPEQAWLNVDETGHRDNGKRWWTWCFRAELYTLYHLDPHRSAEVLLDKLGKDFAGVLGCDYFGAYRRYMRTCSVAVQFCLAHLIRDVKFLTTLPDAQERAYGERLRVALKELFVVFHRREEMSERRWQQQLQAARDNVLQAGLTAVPETRQAQNMAKRFRQHGEAYFRFITTPGLEPTNNVAEQAIRFVVIDRHITQGTRSETGRHWSERIWTVIATCVQQGKSVYEYLKSAVGNWFAEQPAPSLLEGGTAV